MLGSKPRRATRAQAIKVKYPGGKWGARVKDKLERFLHDRVCDGTVRLSKAGKAFRDWKAAFKRYAL